jgi:hypothetical protein
MSEEAKELPISKEQSLEREIKFLKEKLLRYETNGSARLYYSLQRKMNEMAMLLDKHSLDNVDVSSASDKTFERLKMTWSEAESVANAVKTLGTMFKLTKDEAADVARRPFIDTIADKREA